MSLIMNCKIRVKYPKHIHFILVSMNTLSKYILHQRSLPRRHWVCSSCAILRWCRIFINLRQDSGRSHEETRVAAESCSFYDRPFFPQLRASSRTSDIITFDPAVSGVMKAKGHLPGRSLSSIGPGTHIYICKSEREFFCKPRFS